jgi:hypothetical protein
MSQKKKSGLQSGLREIVAKQTAPINDKSELSRGLIDRFTDTLATQSTQSTQGSQPIAPARDFHKVANSINRTAMRQGLFKGKSKQIYDFLYQRTRGSIVPTRSVQVSRKEMMRGASIGSDKTIRENLLHLKSVGLIEWSEDVGAHGGNTYTVNLPEETLATQRTQTTQGSVGQNLPSVPMVESTQGTQGLSVETDATSEIPKTSFKTKEEKTDDDAALAGLNAALKNATKEITGRELSPSENDRWKELADVLIAELKIAAARTTVSSVPAFLAEHLRRRLWKIDKKQARAEGRELPDEAVSAPQSTIDASSCLDCAGSGWWYPEGEAKGVAKCKHEKLSIKS